MSQQSPGARLATVLQERPESDLLEDIQHWIRVYQELKAFAQELGALDAASECEKRLSFWLTKAGA